MGGRPSEYMSGQPVPDCGSLEFGATGKGSVSSAEHQEKHGVWEKCAKPNGVP
jgi:hypothetical protein